MTSRLVNVRLDPDRQRKARILRARGVRLSDVVRQAIDDRFAELRAPREGRDVKAIVQRIFEQYPDPAGLPPRGYDVHDRQASRRVIVRKLRARR